MTWHVEWSDEASRALTRLGDKKAARRIVDAVVRFAETGHGDVKALQGMPGFRLRVGVYRVRFERIADRLVILVLAVAHRRDAYR